MRTLCHVLVTTALAVPSIAIAAQGDARLTIDNRFDGRAEVFVDGRYEGEARANGATAFEVCPGHRTVVVSRPGTHFVLATARVELTPRSAFALPVVAPTGSLRVDNDGEVRLKLDVGATEVWVEPGTVAVVPVRAGNVDLVASIHDPHGDWAAVRRQVWVEPGRATTTELSPDPTRIWVTNHESVPVRAVLDGDDAGWIQPGATERVWVRPGPTQVVVTDRAGRTLSSTRLVVGRGDDAKVIVGAPIIALR